MVTLAESKDALQAKVDVEDRQVCCSPRPSIAPGPDRSDHCREANEIRLKLQAEDPEERISPIDLMFTPNRKTVHGCPDCLRQQRGCGMQF